MSDGSVTLSYDGSVTFDCDGTPGSVNHGKTGRGRHWSTERKDKQDWEAIFGYSFMKAKLPRHLRFVSVIVELKFVDPGTRRDAENFRHPISKPMADVLTKGGWLTDDTEEFFVMERVTVSKEKLERTKAQKTMGLRSKMIVTVHYLLDSSHHAPLSAGGAGAGGVEPDGRRTGPEARG